MYGIGGFIRFVAVGGGRSLGWDGMDWAVMIW